uniref:Single-stranded DNA-binding protein n=1 Tax=Glossina palpalis gambiensis TaxID=67801 RepID=A0A1B0BND0_9MUSC
MFSLLTKVRAVVRPKFATQLRFVQSEPKEYKEFPAPARVEKSVNTVTLLGRVGADPQLKGTTDHPVVVFSVATHTNYKYESGDWAQRTDWHRIIVFRPNLRELVMEYLKKGQRTMIQGKITYGEIKDQEGNQKPSCSIVADDIIFFRET